MTFWNSNIIKLQLRLLFLCFYERKIDDKNGRELGDYWQPESRLTKKAIFSISTIQKSPLYLAAQLQLHHLSLSIGSNIWISTKRKPMLWLASFIRAMLPSSMLMNRINHLLTISNLIASASLAANPPENSMTFWKSVIRKAASAAFFML